MKNLEFRIGNTLSKFPKGYAILETRASPVNGKIEVREDWRKRKSITVGGLTQSGPAVEKVWKAGLTVVSKQLAVISDCLILGLGAGSVVKLISQKNPGAKITGIEIDPLVVDLGRKYFGLENIKNLKIQIGDAISVIGHNSLTINHKPSAINHFDLILVDLYVGDRFPRQAESPSFLNKIKKLLTTDGVVIFNRLYYGEKKSETDDFAEIIGKIFRGVEEIFVDWNKLFVCRNGESKPLAIRS